MENCSQLLSFSDYGYKCIMGMIHRNHEICLHYQIIEHNTPLTDTMVKLSEIFLSALQKVIAVDDYSYVRSTSEILCSLLDGNTIDETSIDWMETSLGWSDSGVQYQLLCFRQLEEKGTMKDKNYILGQLEIRLPMSKIIYWNKNTLALIRTDVLAHSIDEVNMLCDALNTACGISLPFAEWNSICNAYEQADMALSFFSPSAKVVKCADHAWEYLVNRLCQDAAMTHLIHPGVKALVSYDAKHGSQLADTLLEYLENERNISVAADRLFIHRNTMQYRLRRIFDLIDADIDDPDVRAHICLSAKALKQRN